MKNQLTHGRIIKSVKWLFIFLGILFFLFTVFAIGVSFYYKDKVKDLIEAEINKYLRSEISIEDTELSLFRRFPHASFSFKNVFAKDATLEEEKDTLLYARSVSLNFNIIDIFKGRYKIKGIDLHDATVKLKVFEDGSNNYTFWNTEQDSTSETFEIILEDISCHNVNLEYLNAGTAQDYDLWLNSATLSGKFYNDDFSLKASAKTMVNHIIVDNMTFLSSKSATLDLVLDVNSLSNTYDFKKGKVHIGEMLFDMKGRIIQEEELTFLDLNIKSNKLKLKDFIDELPEQFKSHLHNFDAKGLIEFNTSIAGHIGLNSYPEVNIDFDVQSAEISQKSTGLTLKDVVLNGNFTNGSKKSTSTSRLRINKFSTNLKQGHLSGAFSIDNFDKPHIQIEAKADAKIDEILQLLDIDLFSHAEGMLSFDVTFSTQLNNFDGFTAKDFLKSKCHGKSVLRNCSFKLKNDKFIERVNADLQFSNNDIVIDFLEANLGASDFNFKGYFRNALAYLFLPNESILIDASLNSKKIFFDDILTTASEKEDTPYDVSFSESINFNLNVQVGTFLFQKFEAQNLKGQFKLQNKILSAEHVSLDAFDGKIDISGTVDGRKENALFTFLKADVNKCNIHKMFFQLNNFGQTELVDKNIKGVLTSDIDFAAKWDNSLNVDLNSILTSANIKIENGELINYEPIKEMSRFIRLNDLSHIKFETLKNRIEIKNKVIDIPQMSIRSDAVKIDGMGKHTFENNIDYHLQLFLSDILGKRARDAKKENHEFGIVQDDGLGQFTLFIKITGTVDNPIISYDSKAAFENVRSDIKQDVRETFQKIREEILNKNDTVVGLETERERKRRERRERNEIIEEFRLE